MSFVKHKLVIRDRDADNPRGVGASTLVELDGQELQGLVAIHFEARGGQANRIRLELVADVEVRTAAFIQEIETLNAASVDRIVGKFGPLETAPT